MAAALVQQKNYGGFAGIPTVSVTPTSPFTLGNTVVVGICAAVASATGGTMAGGGVGTWNKSESNYVDGQWFVEVWRGTVTGTSAAVVYTPQSTSVSGEMFVIETTPITSRDVSTSRTDFGSTNGAGTITPTASVERILFAFLSSQGNTATGPSGWTALTGGGVGGSKCAVYRIETSTSGSYSATWTTGYDRSAGLIVAYIPGSAPPPQVPPISRGVVIV